MPKSETNFWQQCIITEQWNIVMTPKFAHKIVHSSAMYYQNLIIIHECSKKLLKMKNSKSFFWHLYITDSKLRVCHYKSVNGLVPTNVWSTQVEEKSALSVNLAWMKRYPTNNSHVIMFFDKSQTITFYNFFLRRTHYSMRWSSQTTHC